MAARRIDARISPNTLSTRLKRLEEAGIVERRFYEQHPPRAEYLLTEKGRDLYPALRSTGLLDRLIETALRCPSANIEVGGHTDANGEDAANQALSEKRAQAVVDYLVKAGLPGNRFTAVGYGSTQSVGSNETDEGKAQNCRIEFLVR